MHYGVEAFELLKVVCNDYPQVKSEKAVGGKASPCQLAGGVSMSETDRVRLVLLGDLAVGKSSILKRFLENTFNPQHKPTIEDLFCEEFDLGTSTLRVDFLDTSGDYQFPAMRRLNISSAQGFILVYAIDNGPSFQVLRSSLREIQEIRSDYEDIPIVIVGNKMDLSHHRQLHKEDVTEWVEQEFPKLRMR
ncbi:unnamed protein product [Cyprideis torosa]|uniref:Uncharacterized protein n=1 Tax=Cyprideis torosa TaxID=163714 RepID=A0A7R8ZJ71_9CRUS|nr:unnamed protein product [Cyprideis torosa]CAG0881608.1 unnamed protein product [Cyprideis torosa]